MEIDKLELLIKKLAKLPSLGPRSARRIVLQLVKNDTTQILELATLLIDVANEIKTCQTCGNVDISDPCNICTNPLRDKTTICVVEEISDLWAMERGKIYKGIYHVLGGTLSAIDGRTPDKINFSSLKKRVLNDDISEVIIATNSTLEGQTTGFYVSDIVKGHVQKISRLAHGIPIGGELDYQDEGTLLHALNMRQEC